MLKPVGLPVGLRRKMAKEPQGPMAPAAYVEQHPIGAAILRETGCWPYGPIIDVPFPDGTHAMDYRQIDGDWVYEPGWWQKLRAMPDDDKASKTVKRK